MPRSDSSEEEEVKEESKEIPLEKFTKNLSSAIHKLSNSTHPSLDTTMHNIVDYFAEMQGVNTTALMSTILTRSGSYGYITYNLNKKSFNSEVCNPYIDMLCILYYLSFNYKEEIRDVFDSIVEENIRSNIKKYPQYKMYRKVLTKIMTIITTPIENFIENLRNIEKPLLKFLEYNKKTIPIMPQYKDVTLQKFVENIAVTLGMTIYYCVADGKFNWESAPGGYDNGNAYLMFNNFKGDEDCTIYILFNKYQYSLPKGVKHTDKLETKSQLQKNNLDALFLPSGAETYVIGSLDKKYLLGEIRYTLDKYNKEKEEEIAKQECQANLKEPIAAEENKQVLPKYDPEQTIEQHNSPSVQSTGQFNGQGRNPQLPTMMIQNRNAMNGSPPNLMQPRPLESRIQNQTRGNMS